MIDNGLGLWCLMLFCLFFGPPSCKESFSVSPRYSSKNRQGEEQQARCYRSSVPYVAPILLAPRLMRRQQAMRQEPYKIRENKLEFLAHCLLRRVQGSAYVYPNRSALPIVLPLAYSSSCSHRKWKYTVHKMATPYQNKKVSRTSPKPLSFILHYFRPP